MHETRIVNGASALTTAIKRKVADGELQFVLRETDGGLARVIISKSEGERFINEALIALDRGRSETRAKAERRLDSLFASAFATRDDDLEAYAGWFYECGSSWRLLYEALTGALQEAARLGFSQTQISDAARYSVETYLLRHYEQFVLKPGIRDPIIVEGVREILRQANDDYFSAVTGLDRSLQAFLSRETLFRERIDAGTVSLKLDWDAERWRAPREAAVDRYTEPARTAILVGGGALVVGPLIQKGTAPMLARLGGKVLMSSRMAIGGASVGSIQPGVGTVVGALGGLAIDWALNALTEELERDDFIAANSEALDGTILAWKGYILPSIADGIDVWFDDAQTLVVGWNGKPSTEKTISEAAD